MPTYLSDATTPIGMPEMDEVAQLMGVDGVRICQRI